MKRVVVTGMSSVTSLGNDWQTFSNNIKAGESGIRYMETWERYEDMNTKLGGPILDFEFPAKYSRKRTRTMGPVSKMAVCAAERALEQAGLFNDPLVQSGAMGCAFGSSTGSTGALADFFRMIADDDMSGITATTYIRMMGHTVPVNVSVFFGLKGRVYATSTACTSGSQGLGYAYEAIKSGKQVLMLAGGAEELCPTEAAVFDTLYATSTKNDTPNQTPSPFDANRDGLVIGEGAGAFVLEEREHALARGANVFAEIVGFGTNCDGGHVTQPAAETMGTAMQLALDDANLAPEHIGYINAHGTATDRGDIAESQASAALFGAHVPISSLKGNLGHTLGACGAIEAWASIHMMNEGWFAPTLNLKTVDPQCGELDYIMGGTIAKEVEYVMSNNFAFGGINTSLIFKRVR